MSKNEVIEKIMILKNMHEFANYRIGLAGSVARGEDTEDSDIDIIIDTDDMPMTLMNVVKDIVGEQKKRVDVICLGLLQKEDAKLDMFLRENDLPVNDGSVYKTIRREVMWID